METLHACVFQAFILLRPLSFQFVDLSFLQLATAVVKYKKKKKKYQLNWNDALHIQSMYCELNQEKFPILWHWKVVGTEKTSRRRINTWQNESYKI